MNEPVDVREGRFLRPKTRRQEKGGEKFQTIVKKTIRIAFRLLLLSALLFLGHWVYMQFVGNAHFMVREIEVEGCQKVPKETVLSLAMLEGMPNLFSVKLQDVVDRLETHPWVDQVQARKVFPNKIWIHVEERKPMAIIQLGELYYIDTKGEIFSPVGDKDGYNYPYLTGLTRQAFEQDSDESKRLVMKALELLKAADQEKVAPLEEISEVHMEKTFGIYGITKAEGLEVKMGWEDFGEKLRRLSLIWSDLKKRGISAVSIDCSDLNRMVVKRNPQEEIREEVTRHEQKRVVSRRTGHRDNKNQHSRRRSR